MRKLLWSLNEWAVWLLSRPSFFYQIFINQPLWDVFRSEEKPKQQGDESIHVNNLCHGDSVPLMKVNPLVASTDMVKPSKVGGWKTVEVCRECDFELKDRCRMDSVCPKCGNAGATLIPHSKIIIRKVHYGSYITYEGLKSKDIEWVKKYRLKR